MYDYKAPERPEGCQCDLKTWGRNITPICESHQGRADQYCTRCEHDNACHRDQLAATMEKVADAWASARRKYVEG